MRNVFIGLLLCVVLSGRVVYLYAGDLLLDIRLEQSAHGPQSLVEWTAQTGRVYRLESSTNLIDWVDALDQSVVALDEELSVPFDLSTNNIPLQFFRVWQLPPTITIPETMAVIDVADGLRQMGNFFPDDEDETGGAVSIHELPVHAVELSAFAMDKTLVTGQQWSNIYNWAINNGYTFTNAGSAKAGDHPIHSITWYDAVKWCNARSEFEGLTPAYYTSDALGEDDVYREGWASISNTWVRWDAGYRLPTESEWEIAARGGGVGHSDRFWWGNVISHSNANYNAGGESATPVPYNLSAGEERHPDFIDPVGGFPYTNPVEWFEPNPLGLHDMPGNLVQWCWDWYSDTEYAERYAEGIPVVNPRGPDLGADRMLRGASWNSVVLNTRLSNRTRVAPATANAIIGFRTVLPVPD